MVLLDTCALLWMVSDQTVLTETVKNVIRENADNLFISAISSFEIAVKYRKGSIELPLPPDEWIKKALSLHGVEEIPVTSDIAVRSAMLPQIHNDPCDRIIISTAMVKNMPIITRDDIFSKYPDIRIIWE